MTRRRLAAAAVASLMAGCSLVQPVASSRGRLGPPVVVFDRIERTVAVDGVPRTSPRLRVDEPGGLHRLSMNLEIDLNTGNCTADCGTLRADLWTALDEGAVERLELKTVDGPDAADSGTWRFSVEREFPAPTEGLHCFVALMSIVAVTEGGDVVGATRVDSVLPVVVAGETPTRCDLLSGVPRIPDTSIAVTQSGDPGTFDCGGTRLTIDDDGTPMIGVSGCDHDTLLWLVRLDRPDVRSFVVPAGDVDSIRAFPVPADILDDGVWQPVLVDQPDGLAIEPVAPDLAVSSWPPVEIPARSR